MDKIFAELKDLLSATFADLELRQQTTFDVLAGPLAAKIVLYGAGGLGRKMLAVLRRHAIEPIAYVDNNSARWGGVVDGIPVYAPESAVAKFGQQAVFVVSIASPGHSFEASRRKLLGLGCVRVLPFLPLLWKYAADILPYYAYETPKYFKGHATEIKASYGLLADDMSRRIFLEHLKFRITGHFEGLPRPDVETQYFPNDLPLRSDEVFVDCGAYDGDTLKVLLARTSAPTVYAFEPDPENYRKLKAYVQTLPELQRKQIRVTCAAVDAQKGTLRFAATGGAGAGVSAGGDIVVEAITLDGQDLAPPPTFIKLDIEGAEGAALQGSRSLIQRHKPVVAVCAYHRPDDLWTLPQQLHAMNKDYRFSLRWHEDDGWDTVLYAVDKLRCQPPANLPL